MVHIYDKILNFENFKITLNLSFLPIFYKPEENDKGY